MGYWHVVIPEAGTNLFSDPSFEYGTLATYWTTDVSAGTGTAALDTSQAFFGRTSVLLTPGTAGVNLYQAITTAAADHTVSCYVRRSDGGVVSSSDIQAYIDGAATNFDSITLARNGWYRCVKTATETAAAHNTGVRSVTGGTACYVDGTMFQAKGYLTTYIDGTQPGCSWSSTIHGSTSTRSAQSRAGGRVRDIDDTYGVKTVLMSGYGMPPVQHNTTSYALLTGALLQSMKTQPRELVLTFGAKGTSLANLHSKRDSLIEAFKPDLVSPLQPVRLRYTGNTTEVEIAAHYAGGLEGSLGGGTAEKLAARFIAYDPLWYELGEVATSLTTKLSVANANGVLKKINGTWANLGNGTITTPYAVAIGSDGSVYIGGDFTNIGDANGDYIVKYNPSTNTLASLGTGANAIVRAIAIAPNGNVYIAGDFTSVGGVANTARIARWDGTAWNALSTGIAANTVEALAIAQNGDVYIGGRFTNHGDANGDYITKWDGSAYSSLGTGMNGAVLALAIGIDGAIYAGGEFTLAGGVANTVYVAKWDGSAWVALGTGMSGGATPYVEALAVAAEGTVYAGGRFTTNNRIAKWDGSAWSGLGSGLNAVCDVLAFDNDTGLLYVGGGFTQADGVTLNDRIAIWNGTTFVHFDADLPGSPEVFGIAIAADGIYIAFESNGTAVTSKLNTITNGGSRTMYPKLVLKRTGGTTARLEWLKNETTGDTVWLNYSLLDGETLTIDFTPGQKSITSDFFGNVIGRALLPNSDFASFSLLPGANDISFYVSDTGTPTLTAYLLYKNTHHAVDGGA